jgi:hypothetical protein
MHSEIFITVTAISLYYVKGSYACYVNSVPLWLSHSVICHYDCWSSSHLQMKILSQSSRQSVGWSANSRLDLSLISQPVNRPVRHLVSQSTNHPANDLGSQSVIQRANYYYPVSYTVNKRSGGYSFYQFLIQSTNHSFNQFASQKIINHAVCDSVIRARPLVSRSAYRLISQFVS